MNSVSINTKIFIEDRAKDNAELITEVAKLLREGKVVAFPTETVYGLGANAADKTAASKIYKAKGRPLDNPLIVHISDVEDLEKVTNQNLDKAVKLANAFWPGPLTLILKKTDYIPKETTGGLDTVAVRMPNRDITRSIIRESKVLIAAPSANISGKPSATSANHVREDFDGKIDAIVDGGPADIGIESTIVDLSVTVPCILRLGYITKEQLEGVLGEKIEVSNGHSKERPKAPGMKYKHYAPNATLLVVNGDIRRTVDYINKTAMYHKGEKLAVLTCDENQDKYHIENVFSLGSITDSEEIMKNLYSSLRRLDEEEVEYAFSESFPCKIYREVISERLLRASGYNSIEV